MRTCTSVLLLLLLAASVTIGRSAIITDTHGVTAPKGPSACGKQAVNPDEAPFVGRKEALQHSWPWTVSIRLLDSHHCAGTIHNENWIVTSASCVSDLSTPSIWTVDAGRHCRDCAEASVQHRFATLIVPHPSFSKDINDFNLAMIKLDQPLVFNSHVSPICVGSAPVSDAASCVATGWGGPGTSPNLQQVTVPIVPHQICSDFMHYDDAVTRNMVCAGYESSADSCQADSGGPLACKTAGVWFLHGVASWGEGCARAQRPGVYTRVHLYADWMQQVASA